MGVLERLEVHEPVVVIPDTTANTSYPVTITSASQVHAEATTERIKQSSHYLPLLSQAEHSVTSA